MKGCVDFVGAYHEMVTVGGVTVPYAVVSACPQGIFGTTGFDVISTSASHELIEAATDPFGTAFAVTDYADQAVLAFAYGGEVGDLCELGTLVRPEGFPYNVTRVWSNTSAAMSKAPCIPADPGQPYFAAAVVTTDAVTFELLGQTILTNGIKIPVGGSRDVELDLFSDAPTSGPWSLSAVDTHAAGQPPFLSFAFSSGEGSNGQKVHLTIQVLAQDPNYQAEPFAVISELGSASSIWFAVVGN